MWNIIGGFVVSSVAGVFVKEIVKEIRKPGKPEAEDVPEKPLKHSKGQVMVLDWVPRKEGPAVKPAIKKKAGAKKAVKAKAR
jgi:hypothetical protein